jgi:predicted phosphoribosyltransferase
MASLKNQPRQKQPRFINVCQFGRVFAVANAYVEWSDVSEQEVLDILKKTGSKE